MLIFSNISKVSNICRICVFPRNRPRPLIKSLPDIGLDLLRRYKPEMMLQYTLWQRMVLDEPLKAEDVPILFIRDYGCEAMKQKKLLRRAHSNTAIVAYNVVIKGIAWYVVVFTYICNRVTLYSHYYGHRSRTCRSEIRCYSTLDTLKKSVRQRLDYYSQSTQ